jgi:Tfp pilus assembly protein PilN
MSQLTRTRPTTQVNLLPPETKEQQKSKRQVGLVSVVGAVLVGLLVLYSMVQGAKVADMQDQLAQIDATNQTLQEKAVKLQKFEADRQSEAARLALVQGALSGGLRWSRVLQDVSNSLSDGVWLTSIQATMNDASFLVPGATAPTTTVPTDPTAPAGTAPTSSQVVGTITFTGFATEIRKVSEWLQNLDGVDGWANAYSNSVSEVNGVNQVVYQVSATVDITTHYVEKNGSNA